MAQAFLKIREYLHGERLLRGLSVAQGQSAHNDGKANASFFHMKAAVVCAHCDLKRGIANTAQGRRFVLPLNGRQLRKDVEFLRAADAYGDFLFRGVVRWVPHAGRCARTKVRPYLGLRDAHGGSSLTRRNQRAAWRGRGGGASY